MNKVAKQTGAVIAAAAAVLFSTASFADAPASTAAPVHCMGINSCKGQGKCNTATNACAGQNSCRGKGWIEVASAKDCKDKGGTVVK